MMKNTLYPMLILLAGLFFSCQNSTDLKNAEEIKDRSEQKIVTGGDAVEDLRANAIKESDIAGQIKWSLGLLQEALRESSGQVNGLGEISVLLDENYQMAIKNKFDGDDFEKRVNLANLDADAKNIEIISDSHGHPNPGLRIKVLPGKPGVEIFKNGSKNKTEDFLEIILAERKMVHKVLSAVTNAIKAAQGQALPVTK